MNRHQATRTTPGEGEQHMPAEGHDFKARPPKSQPVLVAKSEPPPKEQIKPEPKRPGAGKDSRPLHSIVARADADILARDGRGYVVRRVVENLDGE